MRPLMCGSSDQHANCCVPKVKPVHSQYPHSGEYCRFVGRVSKSRGNDAANPRAMPFPQGPVRSAALAEKIDQFGDDCRENGRREGVLQKGLQSRLCLRFFLERPDG